MVNMISRSPQKSVTRRRISTTQRKANYHDKTRIRLREIKFTVLKNCQCADSAEMKRRLKLLGIKLDLRLTTAWIAIERELFEEIAALAIECVTRAKIVKGDRVWWKNAPAFVESWGALEVLKICGEMADLELLEPLVPLDELELAVA